MFKGGLGAVGGGGVYDPMGVGGSYSNVNSPVYRSAGQTDGNRQPVNGVGGMFSFSGPFGQTF